MKKSIYHYENIIKELEDNAKKADGAHMYEYAETCNKAADAIDELLQEIQKLRSKKK